MRRTLLIISVIVLLIGAGFGAYFYFASSPAVSVAPTTSTTLPQAGQQSLPQTASTTTELGTPPTPQTVSSRLVQISPGPVVPGEVAVDLPAANASSSPEVAITYLERQSCNVFTYLSQAKTLTRINNKTIPGIQSAAWLPNASAAMVRYLSGNDFSIINTYALSATSSNGFFLPQNISDISVSSTSILTLASGVNGSVASLSRTDGTHSSVLFTTPLSSLRISFAGKNQYLAFSKPSATLSGDAFLVNSAGHFSRIAGPLPGLVALPSPSGKWVLVSFTQGDTLQMELLNVATRVALPLPVATIADKCVWTSDDTSIYCGVPVQPDSSASYPDDCYQGAVHFSDRIWKIDVTGRYAQLVLDFSTLSKGTLDAEALTIDPATTILVFLNKNDGSLWGYSL